VWLGSALQRDAAMALDAVGACWWPHCYELATPRSWWWPDFGIAVEAGTVLVAVVADLAEATPERIAAMVNATDPEDGFLGLMVRRGEGFVVLGVERDGGVELVGGPETLAPSPPPPGPGPLAPSPPPPG
jgi:hypothetical protein